jgi:hypothetical protein
VRGSSVARLIEAHQRGERGRLRDGRPDLPHQFVSLVERALDPDPARRFASAGEMESALGRESIHPVPIKRERTALQKILIGAGAVFAGTAIVGWIASRVFDTSVRVQSDMATSPADYLSVGATALLPFVIFWSLGAGMLAVVAGIGSLFRARLVAFRGRMRWVKSSADGATVATFVLAAGIAGWIAIVWHCWEIFNAIGTLSGPTPVSAELSVLGSPGRALQRQLYVSSAYLSFFLALAIWRWFPRLERDASDASRVRLLKWATIAVASLVVVTGTAPWRLAWDNFEVVAFDSRPAFVIGSSSDELLLYYPYSDAPRHRRVHKDAPNLQRTGALARLFDPQ